MDATDRKDNGAKAKAAQEQCDRYPDGCPLFKTPAHGVYPDQEKIWQAVDEIEKEMDRLTTLVETVSDNASRGMSMTRLRVMSNDKLDRIARWQKTVLLVTIIIGVLAFVGMSLYDHRLDGLWNRTETATQANP